MGCRCYYKDGEGRGEMEPFLLIDLPEVSTNNGSHYTLALIFIDYKYCHNFEVSVYVI